jgi:hypothetical protein
MANPETTKARRPTRGTANGACLCGAVEVEIDTPAFWAWHDHSAVTRLAHGSACATYVGCWKSKVRIMKGEAEITRFDDEETQSTRRFCARCGTPILYERASSRTMVNLPRALFTGRTGREPLYHIAIEEAPEWAYRGEPLKPLKGYPGVMWEGPRRKKRWQTEPMF